MKKFSVIVCDPPWSFKDKLQQSDVKRGAADNYPTMTISEIKQLPIKNIADPYGAILCLWVPSSLLKDGLEVMSAYGFCLKQTYVWVKTKKSPFKSIVNTVMSLFKACSDIPTKSRRKWAILKVIEEVNINNILAFGMGRLFRQTHEICLIGTSNNKIYKALANKSQRSVSFAPNLKHSAKPEHLQDSLEIMFPTANKIELFARRSRPGWTCLGNEIDGLDIRDAINQLK